MFQDVYDGVLVITRVNHDNHDTIKWKGDFSSLCTLLGVVQYLVNIQCSIDVQRETLLKHASLVRWGLDIGLL